MGRLKWWWIRHFKIKDCKHCCLWCEYYKSCSTDWAEPVKKEKNKAAAEMFKNLHVETISLSQCDLFSDKVIEKHTLNVGDEVLINRFKGSSVLNGAVIVNVDETEVLSKQGLKDYHVMFSNGDLCSIIDDATVKEDSVCKPTGKHYPQIMEIRKELKAAAELRGKK